MFNKKEKIRKYKQEIASLRREIIEIRHRDYEYTLSLSDEIKQLRYDIINNKRYIELCKMDTSRMQSLYEEQVSKNNELKKEVVELSEKNYALCKKYAVEKVGCCGNGGQGV